ncbi:hypothetical protein N24_0824 [Corynebacterium suranareeae]|uniref:Thioredoxin n=1 Tax=Corynebacterium suranareeae TaxID=2506452 RepID=A0A160PNV6_9CORY|nr:thioredoxin [Corynebacterium suranareeae]BAU95086.1 hypothetical protein N24_0824 [Corynebacterium suranareeae]
MENHVHDSCSPTLRRDLEVTGHIPPQGVVEIAAPEERKLAEITQVTSASLKTAVEDASRSIDVVVIIGNSLLPTFSELQRDIVQFQQNNRGRFVIAIVDPDRSADVVARFKPRQIPVVYVVKDGASIAEFNVFNTQEVEQWLDHFVSREKLVEVEEGGVDKQKDPRLWRAAELVNAGEFAAALVLYEQLPQDVTVKRAHAAVSVLARMAADRASDPIEQSRRDPGNVGKALAAADMYVLMDQPDAALKYLVGFLSQPEAIQRIVELLHLFDPLDPVAVETRARLANAMH